MKTLKAIYDWYMKDGLIYQMNALTADYLANPEKYAHIKPSAKSSHFYFG